MKTAAGRVVSWVVAFCAGRIGRLLDRSAGRSAGRVTGRRPFEAGGLARVLLSDEDRADARR